MEGRYEGEASAPAPEPGRKTTRAVHGCLCVSRSSVGQYIYVYIYIYTQYNESIYPVVKSKVQGRRKRA